MSDQFKLQKKHTDLADRIEAAGGNVVDKDGNIKDSGVFRKIATEDGVDVDRLISEQDYVSDYIAGNHLAAARGARKHMESNKEATTVSGSFEIGRNRLELSFDRHSRVPNRVLDKETGHFKVDGEKDVYGDSTVKYKVRGAQNSKGDLKAVRDFIQDDFRKAFSS